MTEKIGVLFLLTQDGFGADTAIHAQLMRYLDRDRFVVHVACSAGDGVTVPEALAKIRTIPDIRLRTARFAPGFRQRSASTILKSLPGLAYFPADFVALRNYIARERIRIVHSTERPRDAIYCVSLAKVSGAKSIVHVHVKWADGYSFPAKWGVRNADAVFSISSFVTDSVASLGRPRESIHTVLNCIDASRWDPSTDGSAVRREFGIPDDALLLTSVSRLFAEKGQTQLVQAFAAARAQVPNLKLMIVGADEQWIHKGSYTKELKELARSLGVAEHVVFTGLRADVPQIMAACDLFTMPSFEEPFGLVFLEAMAMKKPVVAVGNGGTPEVVEDGRSGLLSPAWDVQALAQNILTLARDPALRTRMGEYGRSQVLERFNAPRMAHDAGAAYEKILRA
jgi:glycosyltransferase involved in cell wall biosynthesis